MKRPKHLKWIAVCALLVLLTLLYAISLRSCLICGGSDGEAILNIMLAATVSVVLTAYVIAFVSIIKRKKSN